MTVTYMRDVAGQTGIDTRANAITDTGWNEAAGESRDLDEAPIRNIFALFPWEWPIAEYPEPLFRSLRESIWIAKESRLRGHDLSTNADLRQVCPPLSKFSAYVAEVHKMLTHEVATKRANSDFPAARIANTIENYLARIDPERRDYARRYMRWLEESGSGERPTFHGLSPQSAKIMRDRIDRMLLGADTYPIMPFR